VIAPDPSPVPPVVDAAAEPFFLHFTQPAVLCVLLIAILLVGVGLIKWVYRNVLSDPSRHGSPQVRLNSVRRPRSRRRRD
jgi:hypothetical protein